MGVQLSTKPVVTDAGTDHVLLVGSDGLKLIAPGDLPGGSGGGGSAAPLRVPVMASVPAVAAGAHNLRGNGFQASGDVTVKGLWVVLSPASAGPIAVELMLVTLTAPTTIGVVVERKALTLTAGFNEPLLGTVMLTTPKAFASGEQFGVIVRTPANAGNINTLISQGNCYHNCFPAPLVLFPNNAPGIRDAVADVADGATITRPTASPAHFIGAIV